MSNSWVVDCSMLAQLPDGCDPIDSAAIPLIAMTADQLVRLAARAQQGHSIPAAIAGCAIVDAIADTIGGETAATLFAKVKNGGAVGYASTLPEEIAAKYPAITVTRVFARPDASKIREFADDIRDGKFVLPVSRRMPLREANAAHALAQRGGAGKIVLVSH